MKVSPDVGNSNKISPWNSPGVARTEPYQISWVGEITAPRYQKSGAIHFSGGSRLWQVVTTYCFHCDHFKDCAKLLPDVEEEMVEIIRAGKENFTFFQINEVDLHRDSIDMVLYRDFCPVKGFGKIEHRKRGAVGKHLRMRPVKLMSENHSRCSATKVLTAWNDRIPVILFFVIDCVNRTWC